MIGDQPRSAGSGFEGRDQKEADLKSPATFVLVHGAWHGGWCFSRVARILRQHGYDVFTPTLSERLTLTGRYREVRNRTHVAATGGEGSPFRAIHERLKTEPGLTLHTLPCGHDVMIDCPEETAQILLDANR